MVIDKVEWDDIYPLFLFTWFKDIVEVHLWKPSPAAKSWSGKTVMKANQVYVPWGRYSTVWNWKLHSRSSKYLLPSRPVKEHTYDKNPPRVVSMILLEKANSRGRRLPCIIWRFSSISFQKQLVSRKSGSRPSRNFIPHFSFLGWFADSFNRFCTLTWKLYNLLLIVHYFLFFWFLKETWDYALSLLFCFWIL